MKNVSEATRGEHVIHEDPLKGKRGQIDAREKDPSSRKSRDPQE